MPETQNRNTPSRLKADARLLPDERWELPATAIFLALVVCIVFAPSLFFGQTYYWGDIDLFFVPLSQFLKHSIALGAIPLWNPYLFGGAPFVGNPQVSILYPSTLLLPFFPASTALMISEAVDIFVGGLCFWLFARRASFRLAYFPSVLSAVTYMLCGYFVAKSQFPDMLAALAYVPLLLYLTELLVLRPNLLRSVTFGVALGFQLLAAHTQITVFSLYLMVPFGLMIYYSSRGRHDFFRVLSLAVVGGVIAAGLACEYWLPVAELIHASARQTLTLHGANRFYLPSYQLPDFLFPRLFGSPMRGDWHAHGNYWETDNYVGIVPFFLAGFGVYKLFVAPEKERAVRAQLYFWSVTFVLSVWLALGSEGELYRVAFSILPALNAFHDPARLTLGANIAIALFAGVGLQKASEFMPVTWRNLLLLGAVLLAVVDLGIHDRGIYPEKPVFATLGMASSPVVILLKSQEPLLGSGRVLMPDSQRAWQSFTTYKSYESGDPNFLTEWPDTLSPCLGMTFGIREAGGYDPEYRRDSQELVSLAEAPLDPINTRVPEIPEIIPYSLSAYLAMMGVHYLVTYRVNPVNTPGLVPIFHSRWRRHRREVIVYKNTNYAGRAGVYSSWISTTGQDAALTAVSQMLANPSPTNSFKTAVIESSVPSTLGTTGVPRAAEFFKDTPDDVEILAVGEAEPSLLVLRDTLHPGWSATLDGKPAKILRANVDQRAVFLPGSSVPVDHIVEFRYRPNDFLVGIYVTLATLAVVLGILIGLGERADRSKR